MVLCHLGDRPYPGRTALKCLLIRDLAFLCPMCQQGLDLARWIKRDSRFPYVSYAGIELLLKELNPHLSMGDKMSAYRIHICRVHSDTKVQLQS